MRIVGQRHRKHTNRQPAPAIAGVIFLGLLILLLPFPFGGTHPWVQALLCVLVYAGLTSSLLLRPLQPSHQIEQHRMLRLALGLLLFTLALQLIPIPISWWLRYYQIEEIPLPDFAPRFLPLAMPITQSGATLALWGSYLTFFFLCARYSRPRSALLLLLSLIIVTGTLQAVLGFTANAILPAVEATGSTRFRGSFSGPNAFGGFLAMTIPLTLGTALAAGSRLRRQFRHHPQPAALFSDPAVLVRFFSTVVVSAALLFQIAALLFSASRGAIAASAAACSLLLAWHVYYQNGSIQRRSVALCVLITFAVIAFAALGWTTAISPRLTELRTRQTQDIPRPAIWRAAWTMFKATPLGLGPGRFADHFPRFQPAGFGSSRIYHAHNDYLEVLCELGAGWILIFPLLLIAFVRQCHRLLWTRTIPGHTIWIRRAAAAATLAGFLHALVDFNLTARPAVALLFFCAAGIACTPHHRQRNTQAPAPVRRPRRRASIFLILVACLTALFSSRIVYLAWRTEQVSQAAGLNPSRYFWANVSAPRTEKNQAFAQILQAIPRDPWHLYLISLAINAERQRREYQQLQLVTQAHPTVSTERLQAALLVTMTPQRQEAFHAALEAVHTALKRHPLHPDSWSWRAICLANWMGGITQAQAYDLCVRDLQETFVFSAMLAPNDAFTHLRLLEAADTVLTSSADLDVSNWAHERLIEHGRQVLRLGGTRQTVIDVWQKHRIDLVAHLAASELEPQVLWEIYLLYAQAGDATAARYLLDQLPADAEWEPDGFSDRKTQLPTLQRLARESRLLREQAYWMLRQGDWEAYAVAKPQRLHALTQRLQQEQRASELKTDVHTYLFLNRLHRREGLPSAELAQLCVFMAKRGQQQIAGRLMMERWLRHPVPDTHAFFPMRMDDIPLTAGEDWQLAMRLHRLLHMLQTSSHLYTVADELVALRRDAALPLRFRHRIDLWLAAVYAQRQDLQSAHAALQRAYQTCPMDPDIYPPFVNYNLPPPDPIPTDLHPAYRVEVLYHGGDIELTGLDLRQRTETGTQLKLYWRFFAQIPADLRVDVAVSNPLRPGGPVYAQAQSFRSSHPDAFAAGAPALGRIFVSRFNLPPASAGENLRIHLRAPASKTVFRTTEGLPHLDISPWSSHVRP